MHRYLAFAGLLLSGACASESPAAKLALEVSPLALPGVADACYAVSVHNVPKTAVAPSALVWSQAGICASRYGNATGSVTYIGTCDASPDGRINTVSLTLEGLCTTAGCDVAAANDTNRVDPDTYQNPCPATAPCQLERPCSENADTLVAFDLTIMRDADQGFFDIAVNFEDIFCSAKLDCVPELLHREGGARDLTAVLAFACTSGADTCLYVDNPTLTCTNGTWSLDPSAGPGRIPVNGPVLYAAAVYRGDEAFTAFEKQYWNVALGLDQDALLTAGDCTLTWGATASEGYWTDHTTPAESTYPVINWSRQIVDDGVLDCDAHPLNAVLPGETVASVATAYTAIDTPQTFAHSNCEAADLGCECAPGFVPSVDDSECVREVFTTPTNEGPTYDVCPGFSQFNVGYSSRGARFTTSTTPADFEFATAAPGCTNGATCLEVAEAPWIGRLRTVGVWTCEEGVLPLEQPPFNEWVGFTRCLDVQTAGDYMVGLAGDNDVWLRVDGNTIYQSVSEQHYNAWNVLRLPLTAGTHVIELFGFNDHSVASFGAEIAGPWPSGSLGTPAQMVAAAIAPGTGYVDRLIFSTEPMRSGGSTFQTSTGANASSGLSCPDGSSLQICGSSEPTCVDRDFDSCVGP
jgi:hypothetical protein